jgi:hypothetical protein
MTKANTQVVGRFYEGAPILQAPDRRSVMKSSKVERVVGNFLKKNSIDEVLLEGLDPNERRRALMSTANDALHNKFWNLFAGAIQHLGFRNEEVLIFVSSAAAYRPEFVPALVERFCRNTRVARRELKLAAKTLTSRAGDFDLAKASADLCRALDCIRMCRQKIMPSHLDKLDDTSRLLVELMWKLHRVWQDNNQSEVLVDVVLTQAERLFPNRGELESFVHSALGYERFKKIWPRK